jgi:hypothetical protein
MPNYRICFIDEIPRRRRAVSLLSALDRHRSARSPERAIETAKKRFARLEGIRDWHIRAGMIEMEGVDPAATVGTAQPLLHGPRRPSS